MGRRLNKKNNNFLFFLVIIVFAIYNAITEHKPTTHVSTTTPQKIDYKNLPKIDWPASVQDLKVSDNLTRKNYYIVYDGSGSMTGDQCARGSTKEDVAKNALNSFVAQIDSDANVGLFIFDGRGVSERVPLGINNRQDISNAISTSVATGGTPLKTAMLEGVKKLAAQAARQLEYGEYHLVVITDGEASGSENPETIVAAALAKTPITIHTVGFCIENNHSLNQPGKIFYKRADSPEDLSKGLNSILAESEDFVITDFE